MATDAAAMAEAALKVCSLGYATLRTELLNSHAHRNQTLAIAAGAAGLVVGFTPENSRLPDWLVYAAAVLLLVVGIIVWWNAGRGIGKLSARISEIEQTINDQMAKAYGADAAAWLAWETGHQDRSGFPLWVHGSGRSPR